MSDITISRLVLHRLDSSKKWTNKFAFSCFKAKNTPFFRFLEESTARQSTCCLIWPLECSFWIGSNQLCGGCLQKIKRSKFWHIMSKSSVTAQFTLYGCSRSRLSDRKQRNQLPNCTQKKIVKSHHVLKVARIQSILSYWHERKHNLYGWRVKMKSCFTDN